MTVALDAARLRELDRAYGWFLPGFDEALRARAEAIAAMQLRRDFLADLTLPPATLPVSTLRRVRLVESLGARRVWLADDVDGASVALAASAEVLLPAETPAAVRGWLSREAEAAGVGARLCFDEGAPADVSIITPRHPGQAAQALSRALALTRPGGHIVARTRAPWDAQYRALVAEAGLPVRRWERDGDHLLLPSGHVLDGAGDLLVVERTAEAQAPERVDSLEELARAQPFFLVDVDGLVAERIAAAGLAALLERTAERLGRAPAMRSVRRHDEGEVACWYDEAGLGFTAELDVDHGHLLLTFMPYDETIERAATAATFELYAGPRSRTRPSRLRQLEGDGPHEVARAP